MIHLRCGNVWAEVAAASPAEMDFLDDYLSADVKGAEFADAYQAGRWDGRERLLDRKRRRFPAGLTRPVAMALERKGIERRVEDVRVAPRCVWNESHLGWLRADQLAAARAVLPRTRGMICAPTGSGKSEVLVALGVGLSVRWLALVDTRDLVEQLAERYELRTGERAGRIYQGTRDVQRYTVATLQSVHAGLKKKDPVIRELVSSVEGIQVDEAHVLPAETYFDVAMAAEAAYFRVGVTATALMRGDARDFVGVGALGPVVHQVAAAPLVAAGVLARGRIVFVRHQHPHRTGAFSDIYDELVVLNSPRNEMLMKAALAAPGPGLMFVRAIPHGHRLVALARATCRRVEFISGDTASPARRAAAERLQRRDIDILVVSKIFNKGVDIPLVRSGINAAAGASAIDALQRLGRLMRARGEKRTFTFVDVQDVGNGILAHHAHERMRAYADDGHEVIQCDADQVERVLR